MSRYVVHAYPIARISMEVEAASPEEAARKADEAFDYQAEVEGGSAYWAEDVEGFYVDEMDEQGVVRSTDLDRHFNAARPVERRSDSVDRLLGEKE